MSSHRETSIPPVRVVPEDRRAAWTHTIDTAFGEVEPPDTLAFWESVLEPDRAIGTFESDGSVSSAAAAFSFTVTVPGGATVPAAGVSNVGVLPTHRRRGLLTALMRHQLVDCHETGREPLALLTASEPEIYGRFGYGLAAWELHLNGPRSARVLSGGLGRGCDLRLVDPDAELDVCERLYDDLLPSRPGLVARTGRWRRRQVIDPPEHRAGAAPLRCVVVPGPGDSAGATVRGYARWTVRARYDEAGLADGTVLVRELVAADPEAEAALWRFLFDIDLTAHVEAGPLPVDTPLLHLLADPRAVRASLRDGMYARIVDVDRALAARTYASPVDVVIEVSDAFCPWNAGRWRLTGDDKAARCERTRDVPDLALDVRELGSLYLGGTSLVMLAGAGRVQELRPGAVRHASRAFLNDPAPYMAFGF